MTALCSESEKESKWYILKTAFADWNMPRKIEMTEVDPETICQSTGITDKNGREIWENDIVIFTDVYSTESGYAETDCTGQVKWSKEEACFCVTERLSAESWEVLQECDVIGNIFDNPELLDGEI